MQKTLERKYSRPRTDHEHISCSWCDTGVPLPAGDEVGVCIKCGAVVFRDQAEQARVECYSEARSHYDIPTPA